MTVFLIHHADAVGPDVDPQRPLTEAGYAHAMRMAELARARGATPAAIWHSGKLRARQTGEAFLRYCAPFARFKMIRGLSPDDPPAIAQLVLQREGRDVALVGHWPHLPALLRLLAPGSAPMPRHGMVALATEDDGISWRELWRLPDAADPTRA